MIPRKIHYIWVGDSPKPDILNICLLSWKEKLPNFEIVEWNEKNFFFNEELKNNRFLRECYERELWAFVSDYMRVKILYEEGGVYLDTDMLLLKDISSLLTNNLFVGYEDNEHVNAAILGCNPKNEFLKKVMDFYEKEIWEQPLWTIPKIFTYVLNENPDLEAEMTIYPKDFFYPYHYSEEFTEDRITENTYGIHWWGNSWGTNKKIGFLEAKHLNGRRKIFKLLKVKLRKIRLIKNIYEIVVR